MNPFREKVVTLHSFCLSLFATKGKKKGAEPLCCYTSVSPNTCTLTTAKPTPEGASIRILLLKCTLKLAISGVHGVEANTSFILMSLFLSLCHIIQFGYFHFGLFCCLTLFYGTRVENICKITAFYRNTKGLIRINLLLTVFFVFRR